MRGIEVMFDFLCQRSLASGLLLITLSLCGSCVISGCHRVKESQPDVLITHEFAPEPPTVGPFKLTIRVTDSNHQPISGAHITVEANMSHAGMAPVDAFAGEVERGVYRVPMDLTMSGDWVLLADIILPDGRRVQHQIDVKGVAPAQK